MSNLVPCWTLPPRKSRACREAVSCRPPWVFPQASGQPPPFASQLVTLEQQPDGRLFMDPGCPRREIRYFNCEFARFRISTARFRVQPRVSKLLSRATLPEVRSTATSLERSRTIYRAYGLSRLRVLLWLSRVETAFSRLQRNLVALDLKPRRSQEQTAERGPRARADLTSLPLQLGEIRLVGRDWVLDGCPRCHCARDLVEVLAL